MLSVSSQDSSFCLNSSESNQKIEDLISIFNRCFSNSENTQLIVGEEEPIYLPWGHNGVEHAQVVFAHGFFASALHEIAHWCIAGTQRRGKVDYGYWYEPDGRTPADQERFAAVEAEPQAIEWMLSKACGKKFNISLDNLSLDHNDFIAFKESVLSQALWMQENGLPARAEIFRKALAQFYGTEADIQAYDFSLEPLL